MQELKYEVQNIITEIQTVSQLFYQQKENEGYQSLVALIDKISILLEAIFASNQAKLSDKEAKHVNDMANRELQFDQNGILLALGNAMKAMGEMDTVLLADILKYELLEHFIAIEEQL